MSAKAALSVITAGALSAILLGSKQAAPVHDHFGTKSSMPIVVEAILPTDSVVPDSTTGPRP